MLKYHAPLTFLAGSICALGMAPYNAWAVFVVGFGGLYYTIANTDKEWKAFLLGYLFAFGYFLFSLYWIGNALLVEGNPYTWAWPLAVCGLPAILAFFNAFACFLAKRICALQKWHGYLGFAAILALFEYARGYAFTGFPWNLYGYTWADTPFLQLASLESVYLLTWLTLLWLSFGGFFLVSKHTKEKMMLGGTLIATALGGYIYSHHRLSTPIEFHDTRITIVQPNTPQHEKWQREKMAGHFENALSLSSNLAENNIIVWPETTLSPRFLTPSRRQQIAQTLPRNSVLLSGALRYTPIVKSFHNSLLSIDQSGQLKNIYDKSHLVPFGEYIPFQDYIPLETVTGFQGFKAGPSLQTYQTINGLTYSPLICYEIIFPNKSIPANTTPDFIINVTNDAWYGDSPGPYQHFTKARFRAVENGIPVIRAANTGISGLIDPLGRVLSQSKFFDRVTINFKLPNTIVFNGKSHYFKYLLFPGLALIFTIFAAVRKKHT